MNEVKAEIYNDGCLYVEYGNYYVTCDGKPIYSLNAKEFLILAQLAQSNGRPLKAPQIYAAVWGEEKAFNYQTLKVYISTLRQKIEPFGLRILSKQKIGYVLVTQFCPCWNPS